MFDNFEETARRVLRRVDHEGPPGEPPEERNRRAVALLSAFGQYCASQTRQRLLAQATTRTKPKPLSLNLCD